LKVGAQFLKISRKFWKETDTFLKPKKDIPHGKHIKTISGPAGN
jgi:hypothetical protein